MIRNTSVPTCSYRRQCALPTNFPTITYLPYIKLLKNITDKDRHCKIENDLPGVPAVISFSILFPPFPSSVYIAIFHLQAAFYVFTLRKDPDIASEPFLAKLYSLYKTRKTIATIFLQIYLQIQLY